LPLARSLSWEETGLSSKDSNGDKFVESTKHRRGDTFPPGKRVPAFKVYASPLETVRLYAPKAKGGAGLWSVIAARRSQPPEVGASISPTELSQLLWAAQGLTGERIRKSTEGNNPLPPLRAAPSVSGAYPLETYIVARNISDTFAGVYHYVVREHQLEQVRIGDISPELSSALLGDPAVDVSACAVVFTGVVERVTAYHGERGYRYLYLEAGHASQNLLLAGTALGLSVQPVVTFYDDELAFLLGLQGNRELPLSVVLVGR
jgi:SagB-type dehydrogenase family enzyme